MEKVEFLATHTFSEHGFATGERVFETLVQDDRAATHRIAKTIGLLMQTLEASGALTSAQIDEMLLEII